MRSDKYKKTYLLIFAQRTVDRQCSDYILIEYILFDYTFYNYNNIRNYNIEIDLKCRIVIF